MASRFAGAAIVLLTAAAFMACNSSSYAEAEGSEGGPCYPNGTCNGALECLSNRCVRSSSPDGGSSGGPDGSTASDGSTGTPDGSPDASADASIGPCALPASAPRVQCEDQGELVACGTAQRCCVDDDSACTTVACPSRTMECLSEASCAFGQVCCAQVGAVTATVCPATITGFVASRCASLCTPAEITLCFDPSVACEAGQKCDPAVLDVDYRNDGSVTKLATGVCD